MRAKVQESWPWGIVKAFGGREYVKYEYRRIPDDGEAELARLVASGMLEGGHPSAPDSQPDATPAAESLAAEHGLDLSAIEGSGAGGRIILGDVRDSLAADEEE